LVVEDTLREWDDWLSIFLGWEYLDCLDFSDCKSNDVDVGVDNGDGDGDALCLWDVERLFWRDNAREFCIDEVPSNGFDSFDEFDIFDELDNEDNPAAAEVPPGIEYLEVPDEDFSLEYFLLNSAYEVLICSDFITGPLGDTATSSVFIGGRDW